MQANETVLKQRLADRVVQKAAVLYLLFVILGAFGLLAPRTLIVAGDANATAYKILASETLFRLAIVSGLIAVILWIFLVRTFYRLLSDVDKALASLMVSLVLLSVPIWFISAVDQTAALVLVHGGPALSGLGASQLNALAMFFLRLSDDTNSVNSIFSGLWLLPLAVLVLKSDFIPRIVGYLLIIAGCSYLVCSINFLLAPPFASAIYRVADVGYQGELAVVVWLLARAAKTLFGGVNSR